MAPNPFLGRMLERLYASLASGPGLNCRPHNSRQRIDLVLIQKLDGISARDLVHTVLDSQQEFMIDLDAKSMAQEDAALVVESNLTVVEEETKYNPRRQLGARRTILNKLRTIAEESRSYEQETGTSVLNIGYPVLHIAPGKAG